MYLMKENNCFPPNTDINENIEFYFKCCSVQFNTKDYCIAAATLANGGICPINNKRIISIETVK